MSTQTVPVVVGPYNTRCRQRDFWKVKALLKEYAEKQTTRCPTCGQPKGKP